MAVDHLKLCLLSLTGLLAACVAMADDAPPGLAVVEPSQIMPTGMPSGQIPMGAIAPPAMTAPMAQAVSAAPTSAPQSVPPAVVPIPSPAPVPAQVPVGVSVSPPAPQGDMVDRMRHAVEVDGDKTRPTGRFSAGAALLDVPPEYSAWPREKRLRWLQEQTDEADYWKELSGRVKTIEENMKGGSGPEDIQGGPQKTVIATPTSSSLVVRRIHLVDERYVAEVEMAGFGRFPIKKGDFLPDHSAKVEKITGTDIVLSPVAREKEQK